MTYIHIVYSEFPDDPTTIYGIFIQLKDAFTFVNHHKNSKHLDIQTVELDKEYPNGFVCGQLRIE